jgi:hypothetical protein
MYITNAFKEFVAKLTPSFKVIDGVKRTAKGLFAALDIGRMIIMGVVRVIMHLLGSVSGAGGGVLAFTAKVGDMIVEFRNALKQGQGITKFFGMIHEVFRVTIAIQDAVIWFNNLFKGVEKIDTSVATTALDNIAARQASGCWLRSNKIWEKFKDIIKGVFEFFPRGRNRGCCG